MACGGAAAATIAAGCVATRPAPPAPTLAPDDIIDIHQHTGYSGRSDEELIAHQRNMGVALTVLLPAGRTVTREITHMGKSDGLAAGIGPNEAAHRLVQAHPAAFRFFANEVPDADNARQEIEKYLKLGAIGIGEQKFNIDLDAPAMRALYDLAADYAVPILLHLQHGSYNHGYDRFGQVLKRHPKTTFIGHAQTFWANIDAKAEPKDLYPKSKVTPGGLTDKYLADFPNLYGDISAGSGLNSLLRDPDHARAFLQRHQDKILYGSDCNDKPGKPTVCQGARTIAAIRELSPSDEIRRKILQHNARRVLKLG